MASFKIEKSNGTYLRLADSMDPDDVRFLIECTRDWPTRPWKRKECREYLESSDDNTEDGQLDLDPPPDIPHFVLIYCDNQDNRVGFCAASYLDGDLPGVDIQSLAIHPDSRGQGNLRGFLDLMGYLINQHLKAECLNWVEVGDQPQVKAVLGSSESQRFSPIEDRSRVSMTRGSFSTGGWRFQGLASTNPRVPRQRPVPVPTPIVRTKVETGQVKVVEPGPRPFTGIEIDEHIPTPRLTNQGK